MDEKLLQLLACPACKANVQLKDGKICCVQCARKYPIRDGIAVMLLEETA